MKVKFAGRVQGTLSQEQREQLATVKAKLYARLSQAFVKPPVPGGTGKVVTNIRTNER